MYIKQQKSNIKKYKIECKEIKIYIRSDIKK